jgi:hypothetical protein
MVSPDHRGYISAHSLAEIYAVTLDVRDFRVLASEEFSEPTCAP